MKLITAVVKPFTLPDIREALGLGNGKAMNMNMEENKASLSPSSRAST